MRTWIKITEGDKEKGIKALEQLAIGLPKVCINNKILEQTIPDYNSLTEQWAFDYYSGLQAVTIERCANLISKSGEPMGEYDFYFEWLEEPEEAFVKQLEKEIEDSLKGTDIEYEIHQK